MSFAAREPFASSPSRARRGGVRPWAAVAAAVGLTACNADGVAAPSRTAGVRVVAGTGASDTVLAPINQALVVEVRGPNGELAPHTVVRFAAKPPADTARKSESPLFVCALAALTCGPTGTSPYAVPPGSEGTVAVDTADANGRAKALLRLGTVAGPTYVIVTVPEFGVRDSVPVAVQPGRAVRVLVATRALAVTIGSTAPFRAAAVDQFGNARPDTLAISYVGPSGVATLNAAAGTVTGQDIGTGVVYARSGTRYDSSVVRVVPAGRVVGWDANYYSGNLYLANLDGTGVRLLAAVGQSDFGYFPRFAPSRTTVTFQAGSYQYGSPPPRVAVVDTATAARREVAAPGGVVGIYATRPLADGSVLIVGWKGNNSSYLQQMSLFRIANDGSTAELATLPGGSPLVGGADISPDGSQVVYVAGNTYGTSNSLRVLTVATGATVSIDTAAQTPRWSTDGRRIAYVGGTQASSGQLVTINADGSGRTTVPTPTQTLTLYSASAGLAWSPDGVYLIATVTYGPSAGLSVVRVRDGATVPLSFTGGTQGYLSLYQVDWR